VAHVDDLIEGRKQQIFLAIIPRFAHRLPHADDQPSRNHESLRKQIPKCKKARPNTRLSCKIEYFIKTTYASLPSRSAFFTETTESTPVTASISNAILEAHRSKARQPSCRSPG
jgi:hypothetical protein